MLVDKNNKNLLVVVLRSSVAHVAVLCACECKRAYLLSPPNHQPPFRLRTTTRTINQKNIFPLVLENDFSINTPSKTLQTIQTSRTILTFEWIGKMVFERSDGLWSFGCVNPEGVGMNGFGGW